MKLGKIAFCSLAVVTIYSCTRSIDIKPIEDTAPNLPSTPYSYSQVPLPGGFGEVGKAIINRSTLFGSSGHRFSSGLMFLDDITSFVGSTEQPLTVTDNGATLGRVLFYDPKLSLNNTVSCGTCHIQDRAFADGVALSTGFEGKKTTRNSMAFGNTIFANNLFWDSRSKDIHELSLKPVANHIEMGMEDMQKLCAKLANYPYYPELFTKAFGTPQITEDRISKALSMFIASTISSNSKFDRAIEEFINTTAQTNNSQGISTPKSIFNTPMFDLANITLTPGVLSPIETEGHALFVEKCNGCHSGVNFAADDRPQLGTYGSGSHFGGSEDRQGATNIGLDVNDVDGGVAGSGTFKIPSLRNIALTGPYMHDGRFTTLEQVIDHYSHGIKPNARLDSKLVGANGKPIKMNFSVGQKQALIAFLRTLTDERLITHPMYSDPFRK